MNKSVLAIIEPDLSPALIAKRAAWLASLYGYELELLLCDPLLVPFGDSFIASTEAQQLADRIRQTQTEIIDNIAASIANKNLNVTAKVLHDRPISDAVISMAMDMDPALLVKGTSFHSSAERATFTYTDWRLIRKLECPLWLVKSGEWKENPVIIAAVDPTHRHDASASIDGVIVSAGKKLATVCGGKLLLFHTYQTLVEIGARAARAVLQAELNVDKIDQDVHDSHRSQLDEFAKANEVPLQEVHLLPGRTRDVLPAFARSEGADAVVMGAMARSGIKSRILGSTAEQVLDQLPCDILIVRDV
jgi:universal stress protein E